MKMLQMLKMLKSSPSVVRAALAALVLAVLAFTSAPLAAQGGKEVVGGPITTKRFERIIRAYVAPTDAVMSALDRLHEAYLEKFRAEIDPEITAIAATMGGGQPSKDQFEKFLRDFDRVNGRIADADNAFLASVTELLPADAQPRMLRVREARERQRLLAGMVQFGPMMFGGGASFVDLPNLVVKPEILSAVPADQREAFDAALRSQESRVLSQARSYNTEMRKSLMKFFEVYTKMSEQTETGEGDADEYQARAMEMMTALASVGADLRKQVRSNLEANRAGCTQLAAMLPEVTGLALRGDLANRSVGMMGMEQGINGRGGVKQVIAKIRRDSAITPEVKAELAVLLVDYTKEHVAALEAFTTVVSEMEGNMYTMMGMGGDDGSSSAMTTAMEKFRAVSRSYMAKIVALLGERSDEFLRRYEHTSEDGTVALVDFYPVKEEKPSAEDAEAVEVGQRAGFAAGYSAPTAFDAQDIVRIGGLVGVDSSMLSVVEAVVDEWKTSQWDTQMNPLSEKLQSSMSQRMTAGEGGEVIHNTQAAQSVAAARAAMAKLVFELDEKLYVDLVTALGIPADDAMIILLRLERADLVPSRNRGFGAFPYAISRLLASAKIDAATARRIVDGSKVEFLALANDLPAQLASRVSDSERVASVERVFASHDQEAVQKASKEYQELMAASAKADGALGVHIGEVFDAACEANAGDAAVAALLKRARIRSMYPDIYRAKDSAERQLAASASLAGLSDDQLGRIELLRAEYQSAYDTLSAEMAKDSSMAFPLGASGEEWEEYSKRQAAIEQIRFRRTERTEKTLGELRRILGSDLASSVPGLVVDPEEAESDARRNYGMGIMTDED